MIVYDFREEEAEHEEEEDAPVGSRRAHVGKGLNSFYGYIDWVGLCGSKLLCDCLCVYSRRLGGKRTKWEDEGEGDSY